VKDRYKRRTWSWLGQALLTGIILAGAALVSQRREGLYLGLILAWATPVLLFLWYVITGSKIPSAISKRYQECCISVHRWFTFEQYPLTDYAPNRLPMDC
jgi:hypothetical protein